ncbi:MAG: peptide-methionine (S)-S-oxide reductase MsrA [Pseudomonadota bacterium]|nr:peptide-methionine (S)-S-oxide reductase MsrA [Pseudomonadota bacterium]
MFSYARKASPVPGPSEALAGRDTPISLTGVHVVNGRSIQPPFPSTCECAVFGVGCFWGAERIFWQHDGVHTTAVGYAGGLTPNPTYEEVCSGLTGHNEVVLVVFEPAEVTYETLLGLFWEAHDPTQGMRQGNDVGTQYRSGIYTFNDAQEKAAKRSLKHYGATLKKTGYGAVTTEIVPSPEFYYAEEYHQQYLARNPNGYCGLGGTGILFKDDCA